MGKKTKTIILAIIFFGLFGVGTSASAAEHYVDSSCANNGNGHGAGCSAGVGQSGAFNSISSANAHVYTTGDDIYLRCGRTFIGGILKFTNSQGFNGSSTDHAVIGAYYLNGTNPVIGVQGVRPILQGLRFMDPDAHPEGIPSSKYDSMVGIAGTYVPNGAHVPKTYVEINNLEVTESNGQGVSLEACDYCRISNVKSSWTTEAGIKVRHSHPIEEGDTVGGKALTVVEDCEISYASHKDYAYEYRAAALAVINSRHVAVRNNYLHEGVRSEGIGIYDNSKNSVKSGWCLVENNKIWDGVLGTIYLANVQANLVRGNLVAHSGNCDFSWNNYNGKCWGSNAYWFMNETVGNPRESDNNIFYNNLSYGNMNCFTIGSQYIAGQDSINGTKFYNNSCVGDYREINIETNGVAAISAGGGNEIKNNIFWKIDSMSQQLASVGILSGGIVFDYNLWSQDPVFSILTGAHDPGYSVPNLERADVAEWRATTIDSLSGNEFSLQSSSPAIDTGANLGVSYNTDYFGVLRPQGAGWDIGAHEYSSGGDSQTPANPSGLSIR